MARILFLATLLIAATVSPAFAGIGKCLGAYRGFELHKKSLHDVELACGNLAENGDKTSMKLLGTAYYIRGEYERAKPLLLRAAHQGEISSPFLLAAMYSRDGERDQAAKWAYRGQQRIDSLRAVTRSNSTRYLDMVERNVRQIVRISLNPLVEQGRRLANGTIASANSNPFVGKWKIGPNENCRNAYTKITSQSAFNYFAGRESEYKGVRFNFPKAQITLINGVSAMTLKLVNSNTMAVVRVIEMMSRKVRHSNVLATRCA